MSEWKEYKLGDVVELIGGGTPKTTISEYWNGNIPWLSVVDFNRGQKYVYNTEKTITEKGLENSSTKMLNEDDIIISARGTVGALAVLRRKMAFNQSCYGIRSIPDISHSDYLYYLIKDSIDNFQQVAYGGVFDTITRETFDQIEIFLPPLPEQRAIAGVLSSLDDKIDLLHRQNKTLEGMAEAIWRRIFVEEADPEWRRGKLRDIVQSIETGRRPKGGIDPNLSLGVPSIGAENINGLGNYDFNKTKYITEEYYDQMNSGKNQNYDILIYKDGAYIGKKSMFANGFPFEKYCINEHVFILRTGKVNSQLFLYFILEQEELEQLNSNSAQPGLNQEALKSFEIIIPPDDFINDFSQKAKMLIDKIFANSIQIRALSRLRDTLLPKLMSGEVRVRI